MDATHPFQSPSSSLQAIFGGSSTSCLRTWKQSMAMSSFPTHLLCSRPPTAVCQTRRWRTFSAAMKRYINLHPGDCRKSSKAVPHAPSAHPLFVRHRSSTIFLSTGSHRIAGSRRCCGLVSVQPLDTTSLNEVGCVQCHSSHTMNRRKHDANSSLRCTSLIDSPHLTQYC
jgi:hypothetical protein